MAIFGRKPWVSLFQKMSIFRLFELLVFIAQNSLFLFQNIIKDIFLAYIALEKKFGKWPSLDQNHGLTPLEKCQFFNFWNFLFLQPRKAIFCSRISSNTFSWPILAEKKVGKKAIFGPKPWPFLDQNLALWKNVNFSTFGTSCFYSLERPFFVLEYHEIHFPGLYCRKKSWQNGHFWTKTMG